MARDVYEVIGLFSTTTKANKVFTQLQLAGEFSDYQKKNSSRIDGRMVITESLHEELPDINVGDMVELVYRRGFNNSAVLSEVRTVD